MGYSFTESTAVYCNKVCLESKTPFQYKKENSMQMQPHVCIEPLVHGLLWSSKSDFPVLLALRIYNAAHRYICISWHMYIKLM